jgi:CheY-like chemotaxis protein
MLAELLALLGHRAVTAGSVDEAIACCERERFDVVLSDIELGPKLGYELIRYLRGRGVDTPAIALSGRSGKQAVERSLEAGFIDHLVKPVGARALLEAIARIADPTSKRS